MPASERCNELFLQPSFSRLVPTTTSGCTLMVFSRRHPSGPTPPTPSLPSKCLHSRLCSLWKTTTISRVQPAGGGIHLTSVWCQTAHGSAPTAWTMTKTGGSVTSTTVTGPQLSPPTTSSLPMPLMPRAPRDFPTPPSSSGPIRPSLRRSSLTVVWKSTGSEVRSRARIQFARIIRATIVCVSETSY